MNTKCLTVAVLMAAVLSGCFRTQYYNITPEGRQSDAIHAADYAAQRSSMQSFFLFGWVPGTKTLNAENLCKGPENVATIKTQRAFGQVVMGLFVPTIIFTPWSARVFCLDSQTLSSFKENS